MGRVIECSDLDISKVLTIVTNVNVIGSNGVTRYFLPYRQYVFDRIENEPWVCDESCRDNDLWNNSTINYYIVIFDGEEYKIPEYAIAIENRLRTEEEQNYEKWRDKYWYDTRVTDWKEQYRQLFGFVPSSGKADINGMATYLKAQSKKNNTAI